MKAKQCSYEGCTYVGALWQANPKLCKTHALMIKAEEKSKQPPSYVSDSTEKKPVKVYSTSTSKISPISDKQAKRLAEYRKVRDKFLRENPFCMVCGCVATDLHHAKGRGQYLTDVSTFRALCRKHHDYYEVHPTEAKEVGISANRLDK